MTPFKRVRAFFTRSAAKTESLESKASAVGGMSTGAELWLAGPGQPKWTSRRYDRFADEGYTKNVIAFRAVRLIVEGAASVPWRLYQGERELKRHALLNLLRRPNPLASGTALMESFYGYLLIAGNAYLEAVETARGEPGELYALRPDRMTVIPGPKGWPRGYRYSVGGQNHTFPHDVEKGVTPILHVKTFHPLDDHYGLSPIEAAAYGIDLHNGASAWNKALLDNAARPSGALVYEPGEKGASLTQAQFERLQQEMEAQYQGERNAGRPLLLEGGLKWQQMAFSPADMDFINSKHVSAREIALAFGVPPMLLGIPGDNTYSNYAEANRALWRQTILPLMEKVTAALNAWLAVKFGETLRLDYDTDSITALSHDRAQRWQRVGQAAFLTVNEKRAALGYGPIEGGDIIQPPAPNLTPFAGLGVKGQTLGDLDLKGVREAAAARFQELYRDYEKEKAAGKTVKIWRTEDDAKVRESHAAMDGVAVGIDESFDVNGEELFLPCDPKAPLEETANCRCDVEYVRAEGEDLQSGKTDNEPLKRGDKAILTDNEIGNIVFNETVSFSGPGLNETRKAVAHAIINGDELLGSDRPDTAGKEINRPLGAVRLQTGGVIVEAEVLAEIRNNVVPTVRQERREGIDQADANLFFGFRDVHNSEDFPNGLTDVQEKPRPIRDEAGNVIGLQSVHEVFGPFVNSAPDPSQGLGPEGIYIVIFEGKEK